MTIEVTLAHHLQAISESVDAVMSDYTEKSVLFTQSGPIVGLAGIRSFFERFIGNAPPTLIAALTVVQQDIHREVAYLIWKAEPFIALASDTFVIRSGKIVAHTFVMLAPPPT
ncbi:MAG: nuclear transport factor 2 family protein [Chloroflexales bacterium]|nr:nuclear transport factor 2 family protein [Chloroflexales bacterium]